ncbi:MAG TPA: tetratricopeptide repeat protein [Pseudonocardiaceae bacterium]|nr:tetratricopeptide repeat protein [Pseudonocardiaceae bacterium]
MLFSELRLHRYGDEHHVDQVLSAVGSEILSTVSRAAWMPLIDDVEGWLSADASSTLMSVIGHGRRLADDYPASRRSFELARRRSRTAEDSIAAQTGLLRLSVQAGRSSTSGQSLTADAVLSLADLDGDSAKLGVAAVGVAHLLNQKGNSFFRSGELDESRHCFEAALEKFSVRDPSTASLAVDVLKGLGDIEILLDRRDALGSLVDQVFALIVQNHLSSFGRTPLAKAFQFAGDVAGRCAIAPDDLVDSLDTRKVDEAHYGTTGRSSFTKPSRWSSGG